MIANDDGPFEGMDVDLMKRLRNVARNLDLKNRVYTRPNLCPVCKEGIMTVEDRGMCRHCRTVERMFGSDQT